MPKSRLSEAIGVQRVRVGNKAKSEAWLVKGTSCKYVLIAVFITVGCFVAAIVATQITFVSEKHKLVQEEKAHEAMEVVLEKRFLEVGSLLENELRRRLKHTKMSEAVHATVAESLESVDFPGQTVYPGDAQFDTLVTDVSDMAHKVSGIMKSYSTQMHDEAVRSEKLLAAIARHLGGENVDSLLADTAADEGREQLLKQRLESPQQRGKASAKGSPSLHQRAKNAKDRVANSGANGRGTAHDGSETHDDAEALRASIREKMLQGRGKPKMRKQNDLASAKQIRDDAWEKVGKQQQRKHKGKGGKEASSDQGSDGDSASSESSSGSDFIAGRDLQSLLIRFFMRLNKIDSVVFPDSVKATITSIKEKHQDAVLKIEAESSTKREKSQRLRAHWDETIEELKDALDEDGVSGVELEELNHASWMVDELLKEMQNVIDVQDLEEPLFELEDRFKSGEDADAIYVMKELQKMARTGDLPYEWVFGGSTGLSSETAKESRGKRGNLGGNEHGRRPRRHRGEDDDEEGDEDEDDFGEDDREVGGGVMGGAPQYMWWRDYPRQVDNPHWKPPPGMMDNFEFLDREREQTRKRREEEEREMKERRRHKRHQKNYDDENDDGEDSDLDSDDGPADELRRHHGPHGHRNHTRHVPPRHPPKGRRWGDFGVDSDDNSNQKPSRTRGGPGGQHSRKPFSRQNNNDGDDEDEGVQGADDEMPPFGGFHVGRQSGASNANSASSSNSDDSYGSSNSNNNQRFHNRHRAPPPLGRAPDDDEEGDYASFGSDDDYNSGPPMPRHHQRPHGPGQFQQRGRGGEDDDYNSDLEGVLDINEDGPPRGGFHHKPQVRRCATTAWMYCIVHLSWRRRRPRARQCFASC